MQTTYPFEKERRFQSQQKRKQHSERSPITLSFCLPCGALERGEFSVLKVTLGNSHFLLDERESGVGSTNETKNFLVFFIRNLVVLVSGPTPTEMVGSALRREHEQEFSYKK